MNKDFAPVSLLAKVPNIFVVHADVPAKNLREFVALAKSEARASSTTARPATAAPGTSRWSTSSSSAGMDLQHVPYKGTGPNLVDLVAGRTHATSAGTPPLMPHVKSGKLRVIAVGTPQRLPRCPTSPTVAEQGYPGFETSQWYGLNAPGEDARRRSSSASRTRRRRRRRAPRWSSASRPTTPRRSARRRRNTPQFIAKEQARWKEVIQKAGVKAD